MTGAAPGRPEPLRGERPFLILRKKKRPFTPKKKRGPVYAELMDGNGGQRLSYDRKDHSRPLRPAVWEQRQFALYPPAACGGLSQGRGSQVHPLRRGRGMWGRETGTTPRCATAALCRESGTARRRLDRTTVFPLFHHGMAVTAGAGPQTVRKDVSRRFPCRNAP